MAKVGPVIRESTTVSKTFSVTEAEPMRPGYSGTGRFTPDIVVIRYTRSESREFLDVSVSGYRLKKDGTPGQVRTNCHYYDFSSDLPEWLQEAAKKNSPW